MPALKSAGILAFRRRNGQLEVLLVHPGGPYWRHKDEGAWSVPNGLVSEGEDELAAARREFEEETGSQADGPFIPLPSVRQKSGKTIVVWAMEGNLDADSIRSNLFELEWPPRSGRMETFPEVDRAAWVSVADARSKLIPGQHALLDALVARLGGR